MAGCTGERECPLAWDCEDILMMSADVIAWYATTGSFAI
jgi:hypothetical protein